MKGSGIADVYDSTAAFGRFWANIGLWVGCGGGIILVIAGICLLIAGPSTVTPTHTSTTSTGPAAQASSSGAGLACILAGILLAGLSVLKWYLVQNYKGIAAVSGAVDEFEIAKSLFNLL